jgi:hypothetical protein
VRRVARRILREEAMTTIVVGGKPAGATAEPNTSSAPSAAKTSS